MRLNLTETIRELQQEKGISEELIIRTVETAITKAYEKFYGTTENLVIRNDDDLVLSIFSQKEVVEKIEDDLFEISLEQAKDIDDNAEVGDEMLVPCNPEDFGRIAIHSAKQIILQRLRELKKNNIFSEFKEKEGELIIGYIQRIRGDTIYIDLGNYEGILPKSNQASHENYQQGDRIKTVIQQVKKTNRGNVSVILSRTSTDFIKKLLEVEIPEIYDKIIQIHKIVREPGYRSKIAVLTNKDDIDPVGACVGQKGARILNIIKELEGEKIDVIKWSLDSKEFIGNALIPAKVDNVIILDEAEKKATAIVDESQFSYAIGKRGLNIKLANELTDWNIDVKTYEQAVELDLVKDHFQAAEDLFKEDISATENEIDTLSIPDEIKQVLRDNSITTIEQVVELSAEEFRDIDGLTPEHAAALKQFIDDNFEVVIEEDESEKILEDGKTEDGIVYYECPNCGGDIPEDASSCPDCGVEITFEDEEVDELEEDDINESDDESDESDGEEDIDESDESDGEEDIDESDESDGEEEGEVSESVKD